MLREEVLAEIIRPVGYSNVVRLCLQVAFPTLLRNRFQFLSALHTQSCFVCRLSFHYISRLPSQNDPPTIRFGADIGNRAGRQRSIGSTKQRSKHTKRHRPSTVPLMESCRHWPSFQRNLTDCLIRNAKTAKFSPNITRNFAIFVISKPTSIPSYPMRIMRPICTTTLYLPNPISTAAVNLWSDRRKPYAFLRQKRLGIGLFLLEWA